MTLAARVRPLDYFTREEWERLTERNDWMGPLLILHGWLIIAGAMALSVWSLWFLPLSIALIGARQLGLTILMHDGAHGALHSNRAVNDFIGHWLCGAPMAGHLEQYRNYHLTHHKYAQSEKDPDLGLSAPFPITRSSLHRKMIRDLTGQTFYKQRRNQFANALGFGIRKGKGQENRSQSAREAVVPMLVTNVVIFTVLALLGYWWAYFALWLLPMATWMMLVTRLRNIAEHAVVPSNTDPLRHARTTLANPLEGLFIAPYWVNYHCEHHMFMHVPCYNLGRLHRALAAKGATKDMEVQRGYARVIDMATSRPEAVMA
jgi:fatty acid desaturase